MSTEETLLIRWLLLLGLLGALLLALLVRLGLPLTPMFANTFTHPRT